VKELILAELDQESHMSVAFLRGRPVSSQYCVRYREKPNFVPFCIVKECFNKLRIPVGLTNTLYFAVILSEYLRFKVYSTWQSLDSFFSVCLSVSLSVCPSVCLSVCLWCMFVASPICRCLPLTFNVYSLSGW